MKQPALYKAHDLLRDSKGWPAAGISGSWTPARPEPFYYFGPRNLWNRLRLAWLVFAGRCDALQWRGQP